MIEKKPTMRCWMTLLAVLILMMLCPICRTVSIATGQTIPATAPPDTTVKMILVPESKIRQSTALIDDLDRRLGLALNRIAERDSVIQNRDTMWGQQVDGWKAASPRTWG